MGITKEPNGKIHANKVTKLKKVVNWLNKIRQKEKSRLNDKNAEPYSRKTAKDGSRILLKAVVDGLNAWIYGVYLIEKGKFRDRKICQTNLINLSDKSPNRLDDPFPLILKYELGILTK